MNCPKCGEMIFDIYTTEQRVKDMYNMNLTVGWAKKRLELVIDMLQLRVDDPSFKPVSQTWLIGDLKKTMNGLETLVDIEEKRKQNHEQKG